MQAANLMCAGWFLYVVCICVCEWKSNLFSLYTSQAPRDHAASNKKQYNDACGLVAVTIYLNACSGARPPVHSFILKSVRPTDKVFYHKVCD